MDLTVNVKRAIVWAVSFVGGFFITYLIVYVMLGKDLEIFTIENFVLVALPLSFILLIWGDLLMGTKILPE